MISSVAGLRAAPASAASCPSKSGLRRSRRFQRAAPPRPMRWPTPSPGSSHPARDTSNGAVITIDGQWSDRRFGPRGATGNVAAAIARASTNLSVPEGERPVTVTDMKSPPR